jgi:hypothetical protein
MAIVNRFFPCIAVALPWFLYSSAMHGQIPEREVYAVLHESGMDSMLSRRLCERSRSTFMRNPAGSIVHHPMFCDYLVTRRVP